jgi:hypothetical protein
MNENQEKKYICITECINTGHLAASSELITTLEEAKEWIDENSAGGCYRIHNFDTIIEINESGEAEQVYIRRPEYAGDWYHLW